MLKDNVDADYEIFISNSFFIKIIINLKSMVELCDIEYSYKTKCDV